MALSTSGCMVHLVDVQPVQVTVNLRQLLQLPHSPGILRRKRQDEESRYKCKSFRLGCSVVYLNPYLKYAVSSPNGTCRCSPERMSFTVAAFASSSCEPTITT